MEGLYQSLRIALAQAEKPQIFFSCFFLSLIFCPFRFHEYFLCLFIHQLLKSGEIEATQPSRLLSNQTILFLSVPWVLGYLEVLRIRLVSDMNTPLACTTSCTSQNAPQRHKAVSAVAAHTNKIQLSLHERNLESWSRLPSNTSGQSTTQLGLA